nr:metallophosphoesterase [Fundidesulfovibrio soli]
MGDSRGRDAVDLVNTAVLAQVNQRIKSLSPAPEFLVFLGDMSARAKVPSGGGEAYTYQPWLDFMRAPDTGLPASLPLYLVVGNHELYDERASATRPTGVLTCECQRDYQGFIRANASATFMPKTASLNADYESLAYSFTADGGKSLFVALDGYFVGDCPSVPYVGAGSLDRAQLDYLKATLEQSSAKTKFVFMHNPAFRPSENAATACGSPSMCEFWKIVDEHKATAVFNGHVHLYSRVEVDAGFSVGNPGYEFRNSVPQIIAGTCGAPISKASAGKGDKDAAPNWNVKTLYNYSVVDVDGSGPTAKLLVQTYCSDGASAWSLCDTYSK